MPQGLDPLTRTPLVGGGGDVTLAGQNYLTIFGQQITASKISLVHMADMVTANFLGRNTAGSGSPEYLSIATVKTMLNFDNIALLNAANVFTAVNRFNGNVGVGGAPTYRFDVLPAAAGGGMRVQSMGSDTDTSQVLITNQLLEVESSGLTTPNTYLARFGIQSGNAGGTEMTVAHSLDNTTRTLLTLYNRNQSGAVQTGYFLKATGTLGTERFTLDAVGNSRVGGDANPITNYFSNLGSITKQYLTVHAAELWVQTLVAQDVVATIGGRIIVAPSTVLTSDLAPGDTSMVVKHNQMISGDRVYMEKNGSVEFIAVTSAASGAGPYTYSITRNLDGTGANQWYAGDTMVNTGQTGNGFIDIYSVRGVATASQAGPTMVGNIRNSSTYNDWSEHWAIGNLKGLYGYGSDTPGVGLGQYLAGKTHVTLDATSGFRLFSGLSTVIGQWDPNGITVGEVSAGHNNILITSTGGLFIRVNTTNRQYLAGDGSGWLANSNISWDAAGNFTVSGNATIAGWSISATTISGTGINIISGASAGLTFGTTPPVSATDGTGLWLDRTGMYGITKSGGVTTLQAKFDAVTGAIIAGAGGVTLDAAGITLLAESTSKDANSVNFASGGSQVGTLRMVYGTTYSQLNLYNKHFTNTAFSNLFIQTLDSADNGPAFEFIKYGPSHATKANKAYAGFYNLSNGMVITEFGTTADSVVGSTILELRSTYGALLLSRMTTTEKNALTGTNGMLLYDSTLDKIQCYQAGAWTSLA